MRKFSENLSNVVASLRKFSGKFEKGNAPFKQHEAHRLTRQLKNQLLSYALWMKSWTELSLLFITLFKLVHLLLKSLKLTIQTKVMG